jgi:hypothetical protein
MVQRRMLWTSLSAVLLSFVGCLVTGVASASAAEGGFADATLYLASGGHGAQVRRWADASARLAEAFDDVCADTFCEGDYPNLVPLSWRCSVREATGELGQCVWTFAGSAEFVDATTGTVRVESTVVPCAIPVQGDVEAFLTGLLDGHANSDTGLLLRRALPGVHGTLYDALTRCL